ncbi:hypothetical protein [Neoroseomonas soli]|uniref:Uncharacterized protein n=1 Tax=Neoroseomonas soli TaxID=1081025 RepID=A0A9X9WWS2_9PROT|nr:hypothetical protein [Neoroseomonas soli]MBR0671601.1 hypothetical protein [Neoroseomonas soli]
MIGPRAQKRLAILTAVIVVGGFLAANIHLVTVAFTSMSDCVQPAPGKPPARPAC